MRVMRVFYSRGKSRLARPQKKAFFLLRLLVRQEHEKEKAAFVQAKRRFPLSLS